MLKNRLHPGNIKWRFLELWDTFWNAGMAFSHLLCFRNATLHFGNSPLQFAAKSDKFVSAQAQDGKTDKHNKDVNVLIEQSVCKS